MSEPSAGHRTVPGALHSRRAVREKILRLLMAYPMTATELVIKGKITVISACLELKLLRAQGLVSSAYREGETFYSLAGISQTHLHSVDAKTARHRARRPVLPQNSR